MQQSSNNEKGIISVKIDSKLLHCSFCSSRLTPSFFKYCTQGHVACKSCCKTKQKSLVICSKCSSSVSSTISKPFDSILKSISVGCCYASYGCTNNVSYFDIKGKQSHESVCSYKPCLCPIKDCTFKCVYTNLLGHITSKHPSTPRTSFSYGNWFNISLKKDSPFYVLVEKKEVFLLINDDDLKEYGSCLSIARMRPSRGDNESFHYEITVNYDIYAVSSESDDSDDDDEGGYETKLYINCGGLDIVDFNEEHSTQFLYVPDKLNNFKIRIHKS